MTLREFIKQNSGEQLLNEMPLIKSTPGEVFIKAYINTYCIPELFFYIPKNVTVDADNISMKDVLKIINELKGYEEAVEGEGWPVEVVDYIKKINIIIRDHVHGDVNKEFTITSPELIEKIGTKFANKAYSSAGFKENWENLISDILYSYKKYSESWAHFFNSYAWWGKGKIRDDLSMKLGNNPTAIKALNNVDK